MNSLKIKDILRIHQRAIEQYGGKVGVRDLGLIESALALPDASFAGVDLYKTFAEKAGILLFALTKNHGFVDGQKRTAFSAFVITLKINGYVLDAPSKDLKGLVLAIASNKATKDDVLDWCRIHITKVRGKIKVNQK